MKHFVYIVENNQIYFYKETHAGTTLWSPMANQAYDFPCQWIPANPTPEMPHRKEMYVNLGEVFAEQNGAKYCVGNPTELIKLHEQGPRIGQRVKINEVRSDGFVYGTGFVVGYTGFVPHCLTHIVELDNPPTAGAPNEFGEFCTDADILRTWCGPARKLTKELK